MNKKKKKEPSPYARITIKLKDQLVKRLDGHYDKIRSVDGVARVGVIHVKTVEGNNFWCEREDGHYFEIPTKLE